jgi:GntR family transcriptional regulator
MTSGVGAFAPKYQRIADALRQDIRAKKLAPGERLPAETDLLARFNVSLPTLRQALGVLRAEGLIESKHGIGTFVKETHRLQRRSRHRYGRARDDQKLLTSHLRHEIVSAGREDVPEHIAELLPAKTKKVVVRRRHLFDKETGRPEEIGASYIPSSFAAGTYLEKPTVVPKALFLCIEDLSGKKYSFARDRWVARMATSDEAGILELPPGSPVAHVIHAAEADDGTILEISESIWPADRVMILDEYPITAEAETPAAESEV